MRATSAALLLALALAGCRRDSSEQATANQAASMQPSVLQTGWITDAAEILPPDSEKRLTTKLIALGQRTGHQFVIVTVTSLAGRSVDDYTHDLFNAWGIGRRGRNDGVVLLVAPREHRVRVQVGYGLEQILTHDRCARIIAAQMIPAFRRSDYARGIEEGTDAFVAALEGSSRS